MFACSPLLLPCRFRADLEERSLALGDDDLTTPVEPVELEWALPAARRLEWLLSIDDAAWWSPTPGIVFMYE